MGQMIEASLMKSAVVHDPLREHSFAAISYQWVRELFTLFSEKALILAIFTKYFRKLNHFSITKNQNFK